MKASVVFVAAGHGTRFGARRPKQFLPLAGKPLFYWPLKAFEKAPCVSSVTLVVGGDFVGWAGRFVKREKLRKVVRIVPGGAERSDSVRNGVAAAPGADVLLIHDAARALVTPDIILRVARAAFKTGAALAAWPLPDTLKRTRGGKSRRSPPLVGRTVPRRGLWLAQTPQGFRADVAAKVFRGKDARGMTDDVQRAERAGLPVELVPASPSNFKVTTPEDFTLCRALLG